MVSVRFTNINGFNLTTPVQWEVPSLLFYRWGAGAQIDEMTCSKSHMKAVEQPGIKPTSPESQTSALTTRPLLVIREGTTLASVCHGTVKVSFF